MMYFFTWRQSDPDGKRRVRVLECHSVSPGWLQAIELGFVRWDR